MGAEGVGPGRGCGGESRVGEGVAVLEVTQTGECGKKGQAALPLVLVSFEAAEGRTGGSEKAGNKGGEVASTNCVAGCVICGASEVGADRGS